MRIACAEVRTCRIPLRVPYRTSTRACDTAEVVTLTIRDEGGLEGYGAASPVPPLTGDDLAGAARALEADMLPALAGRELAGLEAAVERARAASPLARSALAALDIALHDLWAKRLGVPLASMLGGARRRLITSVTVGIDEPEAMAEAARGHVARGFRAIKVKIGEDPARDLARVRVVRGAIGGGIRIRVDANEGYDAGKAIAMARALEELDVELFEQPLPAGAVRDLARVALASRAPVVADEPVRVAADLPALVAARAARGANIKLMKCGGIREALRIDRALREAGWGSLVGCMDESRASIAAAAHFAAASESAEWIDLDGHLDLVEDPFAGGFEIVEGEIVLGEAPGLGVRPS